MTRIAPLADVVTSSTGSRNPATRPEVEFTYVDVAAVDNQVKTITAAKVMIGADAPSRARKTICAGDVLVSTVRPNLNAVALVPDELDGQIASTGFCVLRAKRDCVLPEYLFYFVRSKVFVDGLVGLVAGALYPAVTDRQVMEQRLPIPSLLEQRRIVDVLSRAEGIVRLRRGAQVTAQAIIPALFFDMFGDPATNPKGWDAVSLGDHVFIPSAVRMPDVVADAHHLCIGGDSIESCTGKLLTLPTVREIMPRSGKYWYEANDVLYSKIRPNLAKAALAPSDGFCSADMYPLRCKDTMQPRFLLALLLTKAFTEFATSESVRAQMPKLNRETLFGYRYPLPPMAVQTRFVQLAEQVESIERQQSEALKRSEAAFQALLSRAFSGHLSDAVHAEEAAVA